MADGGNGYEVQASGLHPVAQILKGTGECPLKRGLQRMESQQQVAAGLSPGSQTGSSSEASVPARPPGMDRNHRLNGISWSVVLAQPRLHPRTVDSVKERADIVDVVGEHVVLRKRGREFVGLCPFHNDKSPSLTVSPAKQFYYCFSCGAGGNSIKFLMELNRSSFTEVVMQLAGRYQVAVETLEGPHQDRLRQELSRRETLYRVLALASGWFHANLKATQGIEARHYLLEQRGLDQASVDRFELGYAPPQWDGLLCHLQQVEGCTARDLEAAGLVVPRKGGEGFYDRFRHRLMVPIRDKQGRIIGFGGRSLDGSEPKYLNSPETEVFDKGSTLFGFDKAADAIRRADRAVVVEGYFDVIALHRAGVGHAVAALGTALSSRQITQLCRVTSSKRIVLNFDADDAGARAAQRAIGEVEHLALQGQLELRVLHLPAGQDPDEFLTHQGAAAYEQLLAAAPLWLDWQIEQLLIGRDLSRNDHFQQVLQALVELLGKLPQTAVRSRYLQQVAERLAGGQARLALQLEEDLRQQVRGQRWHGRSHRYEAPGDGGVRQKAEAQVLQLYLHCPQQRVRIRARLRSCELEEFGIHAHRRLWAAICRIEEDILGAGLLEALTADGLERQPEGAELLPMPLLDPSLQAHGQCLASLNLRELLDDLLLPDDGDLLALVLALLEPTETQRLNLSRPLLMLRSATALLERQRSAKRCRHLIDAWSSQQVETLERCMAALLEDPSGQGDDPEAQIDSLFQQLNADALRFQALYYSERRYIDSLDQQRRASCREALTSATLATAQGEPGPCGQQPQQWGDNATVGQPAAWRSD